MREKIPLFSCKGSNVLCDLTARSTSVHLIIPGSLPLRKVLKPIQEIITGR